jgi:hypothetical protein
MRAPAGSVDTRVAIRCRSWRRTRLRTTAPPSVRPTTKPTRAGAASAAASGTSTWTTRRCRPARRPRRTASVKSGRRRKRYAAGSTSGSGPASGREDLTALTTTAGEDGATGTSAHAQPEAMRLRAAAVVRLERALTHSGAPELESTQVRDRNVVRRCSRAAVQFASRRCEHTAIVNPHSTGRSQGPTTVRGHPWHGQTGAGRPTILPPSRSSCRAAISRQRWGRLWRTP